MLRFALPTRWTPRSVSPTQSSMGLLEVSLRLCRRRVCSSNKKLRGLDHQSQLIGDPFLPVIRWPTPTPRTVQNEDAMDFEYFADFFVPTEQPPVNYAEYADAAASYTADPMIWNAIFDNGPTAQPTVQPATSAPENNTTSGVEDYTQFMDIFEEDVIAKIAAEADEMHAPMFILDDPDDPCVFPGFSCNKPSRSGSRLGDARPTQTTPPIVSAAADKKPSLSERLGRDPLTAPSFFTGSSAFNASSPTDESVNTPAPAPEPASLSVFDSRSLLSNFGSLDSAKASVSAEEPRERAPPSLPVPPAELPQESPPAVTQPRATRPSTPPPEPIPEFEDMPCPKPTMVRSTPWCRKAHEGMPLTRSMYRIVPHPESRRQMSYGRPVPESVIDEEVRARLHGVYKRVDPAPLEHHAASPSTRRKKARKAASRPPRDPAIASGDVSGSPTSTSKRKPAVSTSEDEPPVSTSTQSPVSTPSDTDDADDTSDSVEDIAAPIQDPNDGIVSLAICIGAVAAVQVVPVVAKRIANWCFAAWMTAS
ncbi:hypothetical protein A0H81_14497 [Grifola frondosa]|uniref:Uncharacterized protein n=1 Tax=Grifola frondosa TaxID=5627 RepID=A0A1C7LLR9_GRIFR|nr:hypothetical protein A0H81_14497 [Grifola frondosa]